MHTFFIQNEYALVFLAGCIGALLNDVLKDGAIELPSLKDGKFYFGCFGGILAGGIVGYLTDGSFTSALTAGFAGSSALPRLLLAKEPEVEITQQDPQKIIHTICQKNEVDSGLALRVAKAESNFLVTAVHTNTDGSRDRGLFQINEKYHPEVTDAQAFDPYFSTQFFCDAVKAGKLSWWSASASVWDTTHLLT